MKKLKLFQIILISLFLLFFIFLISSKNYQKEYEVNSIKITEEYNKDYKSYYFTFTYKDITLDYLINSKYKQQRNFVQEIAIVTDENNFCLVPESKELNFIPLCFQDNNIVHYTYTNKKLKDQLPNELFKSKNKIESFNDLDIYNKDYTYLIWNYNGFYYINENENKKIDIFEKEQYTVSLIGYTKDYLIIPDYDSNYTFSKIFTLNFKNGNLKKHELKRNIYFDSYFLGYQKNKLYIVDNKEQLMYEFNAQNGKLEKIKSKILKEDKWENVNIKTLINKNEEFVYKTNYEYHLEEGKLYLNYKGQQIKNLISNNINHIVRINDKDIFYLKKDSLYHFSPEKGEELLLTYFEWNFNFENIIYIN
jgi:hypothetical protein